MVVAVPDLYEPGIDYVMYPHDHALVLTGHLLLTIKILSNNLLVTVLVYSVHSIGERVEDNIARMLFM